MAANNDCSKELVHQSKMDDDDDDGNLFNSLILKNLTYQNGSVSSHLLDDHLHLRPLHIDDYEKDYLILLSQLTSVGDVDKEMFKKRFREMKRNHGSYYVIVIEDTRTHKIIGSSTLAVELKFIHETGLRGRLEDVVVNEKYRGKQLGKILVETIKNMAIHLKCYKLSLDCNEKMKSFYKNMGFISEEGNDNMMVIRIKK